MNRRWICSDVWMDILPSFNRAQLGLKMALLSDRFDILVDAHFDAKSELTIWRQIRIFKDELTGPKPIVYVVSKNLFPLPEHPLPNKIRFKDLTIEYIDHFVLAFLRSNKQIWDRNCIKLELSIGNDQQIWNVLAQEIWPIFATNIRHLSFLNANHLDNLLRLVSSTILTDCDQLNSIDPGYLCPDGIADFDRPNAISAGQALAKWLNTPTKNGQPKELRWNYFSNSEWINHFKETFRRATASVSYKIYFKDFLSPIEPFELVNERTNEKLTLIKRGDGLQRCPIGETATAPVKWKNRENSGANFNYIRFDLRYGNYSGANLNSVRFDLGGKHCIGPLSPPAEEEEEADQSNGN